MRAPNFFFVHAEAEAIDTVNYLNTNLDLDRDGNNPKSNIKEWSLQLYYIGMKVSALLTLIASILLAFFQNKWGYLFWK